MPSAALLRRVRGQLARWQGSGVPAGLESQFEALYALLHALVRHGENGSTLLVGRRCGNSIPQHSPLRRLH